jgi:cobyrinic acid a,c-diamide synthase
VKNRFQSLPFKCNLQRYSTGQIAKWLGAPVVLVLDCASLRARSAAAVLKGTIAFDEAGRCEL